MTPEPLIWCALCGARLPLAWIEDHMIDRHDLPALERWRDGTPVIIDTTLEPEDFGSPS